MPSYATTTDLANLGLPAAALANVSSTVQQEHLDASASRIDTYLRSQTTLPLVVPYPGVVVECNAILAAYSILQSYRGYDPDRMDDGFRLRHDDCLEWLRDVAAGRANLDPTADSTTANEGRPRVNSQTARGW